MIPKKIHYCWFGGNPLPKTAEKCMESWKKFCPDYEIIQWSERNFDVNCNAYCRSMYANGRWAYLSDYARLKIVYEHGGIYLDTDVELVRPIDDLLQEEAFMGLDTTCFVNNGMGFGAQKEHPFLLENMCCYECMELDGENPAPLNNSVISTPMLIEAGLDPYLPAVQRVRGVTVFPTEYFCAKHTHTGIITITPNTYSIHHWNLSWATEEYRQQTKKRWKREQALERRRTPKLLLRKLIGDQTVEKIKRILKR